jgi:hypothetical protein
MLAGLIQRAHKANLADRIETRQPKGDHLGIDDLQAAVDFALAFAMVHEVANARTLLADLHVALKPGAKLLIAEPSGHVSAEAFKDTLAVAKQEGFNLESHPPIRRSRAAVLARA